MPGTGGQDRAREGGPPARAPGPVAMLGPLSVQGDELASQVGQDRPGRVGAGDDYRLLLQGVADLLGPGAVAAAAVLLEQGGDPGRPGTAQGPVIDLPPVPVQGSRPVLALTDVDADEDADILSFHLRALLTVSWRTSRWTTGPAPTCALDLDRSAAGRSPYQRSPAPGCCG